MRRRQDNWINATHILKVAEQQKASRTRILEREVQKDVHEKIQGGYGKFQGWLFILKLYCSSIDQVLNTRNMGTIAERQRACRKKRRIRET